VREGYYAQLIKDTSIFSFSIYFIRVFYVGQGGRLSGTTLLLNPGISLI
jgi:hypothetical protein